MPTRDLSDIDQEIERLTRSRRRRLAIACLCGGLIAIAVAVIGMATMHSEFEQQVTVLVDLGEAGQVEVDSTKTSEPGGRGARKVNIYLILLGVLGLAGCAYGLSVLVRGERATDEAIAGPTRSWETVQPPVAAVTRDSDRADHGDETATRAKSRSRRRRRR